MFQMIINFFETSIAFLSIYDIFIILLFILALVLSIISGIIIVSSSIKKINVEFTKNKSIQNINDKIIKNRLDLIINKLTETQKNTKNCLDLVSIKNISNIRTNDVVNPVETSENQSTQLNNSHNVINLPLQKPLETHVSNSELNTITQPNEGNVTNNTYAYNNVENDISTNKNDISTNIVLPPENVLDSSNYNEDVPIVTVAPENIQLNSNKVPKDFLNKNLNEDKKSIVVNIKDTSDKKVKLVVNSKEEDKTTSKDVSSKVSNYEDSRKIPLSINKDIESVNYEDSLEEDGEVTYSNNKQKPLRGISLANHFLNQIPYFTDNEKFEITNYISNSGNYIKCLVDNKFVPLSFKELKKQLTIQRLCHHYKYPLDLLETNVPVELGPNSIKKCDLIVFNQNDNPYIICIISSSEEDKSLNLLSKLVKVSDATFGILVNDKQIQYYKNSQDNLEVIEDIPICNKNLEKSQENNYSQLESISDTKGNLKRRDSRHFNQPTFKGSNHNPNSFARDKYNIYRKNPYNVSDEYISIIDKYRNLSSNYTNIHSNLYRNRNYNSNRNNNIPLQQNNSSLSSSVELNLSNNNPRNSYMNRYTNIYNPSRPIVNNLIPNNSYRSHFRYRHTDDSKNIPPIPAGYVNTYPHIPHVNVHNFPPRSFVPSYNSRPVLPVNSIPVPHSHRPMGPSNYMPPRVSQSSIPIRANPQHNMVNQSMNNTVNGRGFQSYKNLASNYIYKAIKPQSPSLFNTKFKLNK